MDCDQEEYDGTYALQCKKHQNNKSIKWPSGNVFSSYPASFPATLSPYYQRGSTHCYAQAKANKSYEDNLYAQTKTLNSSENNL